MLSFSSLIRQRLLIVLFVTAIFGTVKSQNRIPDDAKCYVVIGAFNLERNASLFTNYFKQKGVNANYKKNTYRNMFYVYTFASKDREETKNRLFKFREEYPVYYDSWLYAGNFKGPHIPGDQWMSSVSSTENTSVTKKAIASRNQSEDKEKGPTLANNTSTIENKESESKVAKSSKPIEITEQETSPSLIVEKVSAPPLEEGTYRVYVNSYDAVTLKEVTGTFTIFDTERGKEINKIPAHAALVINKPKNATNRITIASDIFDYRKEEHTIDLDEPLIDGEDKVEIVGDSILIHFPMARFNKGDIITMWQVYFYKDAAIMKEESVGQLNQLLRMMQSNPNMKIQIHGHTNGNSHGKVLHLSEGDMNFFSIKAGAHEEIQASAKKLSEYRAFTIQHWLMDQGITEDRLTAIGWGGKKMIYDKHDTQAHKNVRVDIEIIEE